MRLNQPFEDGIERSQSQSTYESGNQSGSKKMYELCITNGWQKLTCLQIRILLEAVDRHLQHHTEEQNARERYSTEAQRNAAKVPWKQVAEYMEKRGCYRYGNATVKKKYLKVMDDPLNL
jgi:hypothetical protein